MLTTGSEDPHRCAEAAGTLRVVLVNNSDELAGTQGELYLSNCHL